LHSSGDGEEERKLTKNNMSRKNIYDKDLGYTILKPIVDWNTKHSYRKIEVTGKENIPTDGAVIIAPNHCNTLMDALVILQAFKDESVFGARADIFNKPFIAKIMTFVRILPMVRQRDGLRNVLKNNETQEIIVDTLENKVRFCMYPEGRHRPAHSLQTLGKGTFRAALAANSKFGDKMPVYIVPTGIEYGDYFRYRSTCLITFGEAINVTEFVKGLNVENEVQMIEPLRKELASRMSKLITFIKDDEQLYNKWALTKMLAADKGLRYGDFGRSLHKGMLANREIVADIEKACEDKPEEMEKLLEKVAEFDKKRRKKGISIYSFRKKNEVLNAAGKAFAALIGLPYWIFSAIVSSPMWLTYNLLRSKTRDKAFHNTVGFGVKLALGTILLITYAILAFCLLPWPYALALTLLTIPSYSYFFDYLEGMRRYISDLKLLGEKKLRGKFKDIVKEFKKLY
jgi:1-acyl-sn-glycerol-3-phosphate acyltransferase